MVEREKHTIFEYAQMAINKTKSNKTTTTLIQKPFVRKMIFYLATGAIGGFMLDLVLGTSMIYIIGTCGAFLYLLWGWYNGRA